MQSPRLKVYSDLQVVLRVISRALDITALAICAIDWLPSTNTSLLKQTTSTQCIEDVTLTLVTTILTTHNTSSVLGAPSTGSHLGDSANTTTWTCPLIPLNISLYVLSGATQPLLYLKSFTVMVGCLGSILGFIWKGDAFECGYLQDLRRRHSV